MSSIFTPHTEPGPSGERSPFERMVWCPGSHIRAGLWLLSMRAQPALLNADHGDICGSDRASRAREPRHAGRTPHCVHAHDRPTDTRPRGTGPGGRARRQRPPPCARPSTATKGPAPTHQHRIISAQRSRGLCATATQFQHSTPETMMRRCTSNASSIFERRARARRRMFRRLPARGQVAAARADIVYNRQTAVEKCLFDPLALLTFLKPLVSFHPLLSRDE